MSAGAQAEVVACIAKARVRYRLAASAPVHSCYEAGRDGWWLHRWLRAHGIDNIVVDSASIEVNRRARRAKTDRLDGDKLLAMLLRHHAGERVWSVLHEPTAEAEDARRAHRELERLLHERIAHTNRIGSLLVLHNLRPQVIIGGRDWAAWWEQHRAQVPPLLGAEIERESARLALVRQQIMALDTCAAPGLAAETAAAGGTADAVARHWTEERLGAGQGSLRLAPLCQPARAGRLPGPGPHALRQRGQPDRPGHQKAGNRRVRALLVELAWKWLSLQPTSALTEWFNRRFAAAGKRMRRVGIVAVARRLAIALWRYLQNGEIPTGAMLKPLAA